MPTPTSQGVGIDRKRYTSRKNKSPLTLIFYGTNTVLTPPVGRVSDALEGENRGIFSLFSDGVVYLLPSAPLAGTSTGTGTTVCVLRRRYSKCRGICKTGYYRYCVLEYCTHQNSGDLANFWLCGINLKKSNKRLRTSEFPILAGDGEKKIPLPREET